MNIKFYEELEYVINDLWDSLPDTVKEAINKVYDKYEEDINNEKENK
tara:strand:- start:411 stop:551 length:141 start_codon:yes stop_codon:yes gene_type:complete